MRDSPSRPVGYEWPEMQAVLALSKGEASSHEQMLALNWIVEMACDLNGKDNGPAWRSDAEGGERDSSFHAGRNFAGQQIMKLVWAPDDIRKRKREEWQKIQSQPQTRQPPEQPLMR